MSADPDAAVVKTSENVSVRRRKVPTLLVLNVATIFLGIGLWWAISLTGLQIPTPPEVIASAVELIQRGTLITDIGASLRRVLTGFLLGSLLAVPVGFLMGWYGWARGLLEPWMQFFRTIPPLAIIPLAIVLMGIGEQQYKYIHYYNDGLGTPGSSDRVMPSEFELYDVAVRREVACCEWITPDWRFK